MPRFSAWILAALMAAAFPARANVLTARRDARIETQLRRFLGTASSRADAAQALARAKELYAMMVAAAARHGVPKELVAIPYVESRFRNLDETANRRHSCAGLWQLNRSTARYLGLRVSQDVDERLDPEKATDAAMRYLAELRDELGDWSTAVVAYNVGKTRLRKEIRAEGHADAWRLLHRPRVGKFLLRVAAASLIVEHALGQEESLPFSALTASLAMRLAPAH